MIAGTEGVHMDTCAGGLHLSLVMDNFKEWFIQIDRPKEKETKNEIKT